MAIYTTTLYAASNTITYIRPTVAAFETILTSAGWVQTGDTGQTASGSFPGGSGTATASGYQIWRMADALQGTYPVYVKFEWGSGSVATSLGLWFTIGTGSNGTGTITGILASRIYVGQSTAVGSLYPSYFSGSTGRLNGLICYSVSQTGMGLYFNIERTKNSSNADDGLGIIFQAAAPSAGTALISQYIPFTGTIRAAQTVWMCVNPTGQGSMSDGAGTVSALPVMPYGITGGANPGIGTLVYYTSDLAIGNTLAMTFRGSNHTYFATGTPAGWPTTLSQSWANSCLLFLYE